MTYNRGSYSLVGLDGARDGATIMQGKRTRTSAAAQPQPTAKPPRKRSKHRRSRAPESTHSTGSTRAGGPNTPDTPSTPAQGDATARIAALEAELAILRAAPQSVHSGAVATPGVVAT